MSILPTWPFIAAGIVAGLLTGAYVDHRIMQGRIDKITTAHTETLRLREVERAASERRERDRENALAQRAGQIEQEKENAINAVRTDADALIARLRQQAASKPTNPGRVPTAAPACETAAGTDVPVRTGEDLVALAQRADEMRAALGACYQAYDSVSAK